METSATILQAPPATQKSETLPQQYGGVGTWISAACAAAAIGFSLYDRSKAGKKAAEVKRQYKEQVRILKTHANAAERSAKAVEASMVDAKRHADALEAQNVILADSKNREHAASMEAEKEQVIRNIGCLRECKKHLKDIATFKKAIEELRTSHDAPIIMARLADQLSESYAKAKQSAENTTGNTRVGLQRVIDAINVRFTNPPNVGVNYDDSLKIIEAFLDRESTLIRSLYGGVREEEETPSQ